MHTLTMTSLDLRSGTAMQAKPFRKNALSQLAKLWGALVLALIIFLTLLALFPANWLARWIAQESAGRIILADARGSLWQGSAVLGFAEAAQQSDNRPLTGRALSLPGRIEWTIKPDAAGVSVLIRHEGVLAHPLQVRITPSRLAMEAGAASLPLALSRLAGAPMNTLRLQGLARLQWHALSLPLRPASSNAGSAVAALIQLDDVRSSMNAALASAGPLGTYRIRLESDPAGRMQWQVNSLAGPLLVEGQGNRSGGFSGRAQLAAGTPLVIAQRLQPLLNMLGRRVNRGDNEHAVTIQIGS